LINNVQRSHPGMLTAAHESRGEKEDHFAQHCPYHRDIWEGYPVAIRSFRSSLHTSGVTLRRHSHQRSHLWATLEQQEAPTHGYSPSWASRLFTVPPTGTCCRADQPVRRACGWGPPRERS